MKTLCVVVMAGLLMASCSAPNPNPSNAATWDDRAQVEAIFQSLDRIDQPVAVRVDDYTDDAVILVPGEREIRGHDAIAEHLGAIGVGVSLVTEHQIVELSSFETLVVVQGRVVGTATPDNSEETFAFETKNLILLRRRPDGELKIWRVIYNAAPAPGA